MYRLCISYDLTILTELAVEPVAERKFNDAARQYFSISTCTPGCYRTE